MSADVKICGLMSAHMARVAAKAGARYLGYVFVPKSPRGLTPEQARTIHEALDMVKRPESVSLTVDADDDILETIIAKADPDWLQLHGAETPDRVRAVKERFGKPVIKAIPIDGPEDLARATEFEGIADRLLFDAKAPAQADLPGGNGLAFNYGILAGANFKTPWFLAGGLTPETVGGALTASGAQAVDVSSGVEQERGVKSTALIEQFLAAARQAKPRTDGEKDMTT